MNKIKANMFFLLSMLLTLTGCFDSTGEAPTNKQIDELEKQPFVIKPEIYGDPDIFDSPRIQFSMRAPEDRRDTIWSIKTDGTDLRQTVDNELLRGNSDAVFNHPPVRSPDNRYIAISMMTSEGLEKRLIDLKTKTKITFAKGGASLYFSGRLIAKRFFFIWIMICGVIRLIKKR